MCRRFFNRCQLTHTLAEVLVPYHLSPAEGRRRKRTIGIVKENKGKEITRALVKGKKKDKRRDVKSALMAQSVVLDERELRLRTKERTTLKGHRIS